MDLLWVLVIILLLAWVGGFALNVGSLIHILLVIALVVVVVRLLQGRRVL